MGRAGSDGRLQPDYHPYRLGPRLVKIEARQADPLPGPMVSEHAQGPRTNRIDHHLQHRPQGDAHGTAEGRAGRCSFTVSGSFQRYWLAARAAGHRVLLTGITATPCRVRPGAGHRWHCCVRGGCWRWRGNWPASASMGMIGKAVALRCLLRDNPTRKKGPAKLGFAGPFILTQKDCRRIRPPPSPAAHCSAKTDPSGPAGRFRSGNARAVRRWCRRN